MPIGLMGDAKNPGQLIANMGDKRPAELGDTRNPRMGLTYAAQEILEAFDRRDREALQKALLSFINMAESIKEIERENPGGHSPEEGRKDSEGWP